MVMHFFMYFCCFWERHIRQCPDDCNANPTTGRFNVDNKGVQALEWIMIFVWFGLVAVVTNLDEDVREQPWRGGQAQAEICVNATGS
jgi:hypothetical protein